MPSSEIRIPQGWPLDANGELTCTTCHYRLPSLQGDTERFLRSVDDPRVEEAGFCAACHSQGRQSAASAHWMVVGSAHPQSRSNADGGAQGLLDRESKRCLECHDGVNAVESSELVPGNRPRSVGDGTRNHPVGVSYVSLRPRKSDVRLRPVNLLPEAIELPDGKVSCASCHDLYAMTPGRLTVPIEGSELCFSCHDLK